MSRSLNVEARLENICLLRRNLGDGTCFMPALRGSGRTVLRKLIIVALSHRLMASISSGRTSSSSSEHSVDRMSKLSLMSPLVLVVGVRKSVAAAA